MYSCTIQHLGECLSRRNNEALHMRSAVCLLTRPAFPLVYVKFMRSYVYLGFHTCASTPPTPTNRRAYS